MLYRNSRFPVGTTVYIDPKIRNTYPNSPIADRCLEVVEIEVPFLDLILGRYKNEVPVNFRGVWCVEERFVRLPRSTRE